MPKDTMNNLIAKDVAQVIDTLLRTGAHRATKYIDKNLTVKATKKNFSGKRPSKGLLELAVTIGRPNFAERRYIEKLLQVGEPFPVKKIQVKPWPTKKR